MNGLDQVVLIDRSEKEKNVVEIMSILKLDCLLTSYDQG